MKKFIITGAALVALAVPAVASADAPDGSITFNDASGITSLEQAGTEKAIACANGENLNGWGASALIQNGQFISGKYTGTSDWQHQKGNRAALLQAELAMTGLGHLDPTPCP
jgi:hypothetical protein